MSRVLALVHRHLIPPDKVEDGTDLTAVPWRTEYDVVSTLRATGHEVQVLGDREEIVGMHRIGNVRELLFRQQRRRWQLLANGRSSYTAGVCRPRIRRPAR